MRVSVEGPIGAGKSTLLQRLAQAQQYPTVREAAEQHFGLLGKFHTDKARWSFLLQTRILCSYAASIRQVDQGDVPIVVERSPFSSLWSFAESQWQCGAMDDEEWQALRDLYSLVGWQPDVMVYLQIPPAVSLLRAKMRGRECERGLDLQYVQELEFAGDAMVNRFREGGGVVHVVDASLPPDSVYDEVVCILGTL